MRQDALRQAPGRRRRLLVRAAAVVHGRGESLPVPVQQRPEAGDRRRWLQQQGSRGGGGSREAAQQRWWHATTAGRRAADRSRRSRRVRRVPLISRESELTCPGRPGEQDRQARCAAAEGATSAVSCGANCIHETPHPSLSCYSLRLKKCDSRFLKNQIVPSLIKFREKVTNIYIFK